MPLLVQNTVYSDLIFDHAEQRLTNPLLYRLRPVQLCQDPSPPPSPLPLRLLSTD